MSASDSNAHTRGFCLSRVTKMRFDVCPMVHKGCSTQSMMGPLSSEACSTIRLHSRYAYRNRAARKVPTRCNGNRRACRAWPGTRNNARRALISTRPHGLTCCFPRLPFWHGKDSLAETVEARCTMYSTYPKWGFDVNHGVS